jgi:redox-sensitive bicupin YhaK (pirin superfamily)
MHSEFNHKADQTTHFLQIWIQPNVKGIEPGYEQKQFGAADKRGRLRLVVSPDGSDGSVTVHADARLYAGLLDGDEKASLTLDPARKSYVHLVRGELEVNGTKLATGDAAMVEGETQLALTAGNDAEVLVFDLAA